MLQETFAQLSISEQEQSVYNATLRIGPTAASVIAKEADLPRQTTYSILLRLAEEGLVETSDLGGVRRFSADPLDLLSCIDRRRKQLEKERRAVERALPKLLDQKRKTHRYPKVTYCEGRDGLERLFEHMMRQFQDKGIREFRGYGINMIHDLMDGYIVKHVQDRAALGVRSTLMIGRGPENVGLKDMAERHGREIKQLDIDPGDAGIYLVGNTLYLFSYEDRVGVMIENEAVVEFLARIYDDHWHSDRSDT